jgi:hypothetical protein
VVDDNPAVDGQLDPFPAYLKLVGMEGALRVHRMDDHFGIGQADLTAGEGHVDDRDVVTGPEVGRVVG